MRYTAVSQVRQGHPRAVREHRGVSAQLALEIQQIGFQVDLEAELVDGVPLIAPAGPVGAPQHRGGVDVAAGHSQLGG